MLHGDISNRRGYVFGFRCEDCLLEFKDSSIIDIAMNIVKGKAHNSRVNKDILNAMNYIFWDTDWTVSLIIREKNYTDEMKRFLSDFPFSQVSNIIRNPSEITMMLNSGELSYYIDTNEQRRSDINSKFAIGLEELNLMLKRGTNRFEHR